MRNQTIGGRRQTAAAFMATTTAGLLALAFAGPAAAQEPPPEDVTTIPEATIPSDSATTTPDSTVTIAETTTTSSTLAEPTTTTASPGEPLEPEGPKVRESCREWSYSEYAFVAQGPFAEGDVIDDPHSDFSVTISVLQMVGNRLRLGLDGNAGWIALTIVPDDLNLRQHMRIHLEPTASTTITLGADMGDSIGTIEFCFPDADAIGAPKPAPTTVTSAPQEAIGATTAPPVTATIVAPPVPTTEGAADDAGTLPETGNDVLPVALAGAGLAAVGAGLLLGRRVRRPAALPE